MDKVNWQQAFAARLERYQRYADRSFRYIKSADEREEATAEAIALCWRRWLKHVARGIDPRCFDMFLLRYSVQEVHRGKSLVPTRCLTEPLSRGCQRCHKFRLERGAGSQGSHFEVSQFDAIQDERHSSPAELATARVDWFTWADALKPKHKELANHFAEGHSALSASKLAGCDRKTAQAFKRDLVNDWQQYAKEGTFPK